MTDDPPAPDPWAPAPTAPLPYQPVYNPLAALAPQGYPPPGYAPGGPPHPFPPALGPYSPLVGRPLVSNETTWSMLAHLSIFALGIIGPIIVMLTEGKKSPYTRYHAVEALNMHLTLLIVEVVCMVTFFLILPLLLLFCAAIAAYVFGVIASMAATRGETYRYPMILRLVS